LSAVRVHTGRDRILFLKSWAVSHFYPEPILNPRTEEERGLFPTLTYKSTVQTELNGLLSELNFTAQGNLQALNNKIKIKIKIRYERRNSVTENGRK